MSTPLDFARDLEAEAEAARKAEHRERIRFLAVAWALALSGVAAFLIISL